MQILIVFDVRNSRLILIKALFHQVFQKTLHTYYLSVDYFVFQRY